MSVSVCVTFVVFTDHESCTRPISTNSRSMEAGEYGLTRGTRLLACDLELDAVAGLLWITWCVLGGADFSPVFFFRFFFLRTHTACASMRLSCLIYLSTSNSVVEHSVAAVAPAVPCDYYSFRCLFGQYRCHDTGSTKSTTVPSINSSRHC